MNLIEKLIAKSEIFEYALYGSIVGICAGLIIVLASYILSRI